MWRRLSGLSVERRSIPPADVGDVLHALRDPCNAFMVQRAPFPAIRNRVRIGTHLVGPKALQMLALSEQHSHVRTKELVSRARQEIAVQRRYVDQSVRSIVDSIDVGKRAGFVREMDNFLHRINCANRV